MVLPEIQAFQSSFGACCIHLDVQAAEQGLVADGAQLHERVLDACDSGALLAHEVFAQQPCQGGLIGSLGAADLPLHLTPQVAFDM